MTNQNDKINDSLFTEIELDEATNVNGGRHRRRVYSTYSAYFLARNPNRFRLRNVVGTTRRGNFRRFDRNLGGILAPLRRAGIRI